MPIDPDVQYLPYTAQAGPSVIGHLVVKIYSLSSHKIYPDHDSCVI